jgi:hypothetical protein
MARNRRVGRRAGDCRTHCKLGTVTQPKPKTATAIVVSSSSPTVGTRLPSGAKVNVKVRAA